MLYLASPYSHEDPIMLKTRYLLTMQCVAGLLKQGILSYSPIVHFHELAARFLLPADATFWMKHNIRMLRSCDAIGVLKIDGWEKSEGVAIEMKLASKLNLPCIFVNEDGKLL